MNSEVNAAQEAVARIVAVNGRGVEIEWISGSVKIGDKLYAAPVAAALVDASRERDLLAEAIGNAAIKSGIYRAGLGGMSGPQLLMACDDMAQCILDASIPAMLGIDLTPFRLLVEGCEAEFIGAGTEDMEPDDSKVSFPEDRCHITFGMIRDARKALEPAPRANRTPSLTNRDYSTVK